MAAAVDDADDEDNRNGEMMPMISATTTTTRWWCKNLIKIERKNNSFIRKNEQHPYRRKVLNLEDTPTNKAAKRKAWEATKRQPPSNSQPTNIKDPLKILPRPVMYYIRVYILGIWEKSVVYEYVWGPKKKNYKDFESTCLERMNVNL